MQTNFGSLMRAGLVAVICLLLLCLCCLQNDSAPVQADGSSATDLRAPQPHAKPETRNATANTAEAELPFDATQVERPSCAWNIEVIDCYARPVPAAEVFIQAYPLDPVNSGYRVAAPVRAPLTDARGYCTLQYTRGRSIVRAFKSGVGSSGYIVENCGNWDERKSVVLTIIMFPYARITGIVKTEFGAPANGVEVLTCPHSLVHSL